MSERYPSENTATWRIRQAREIEEENNALREKVARQQLLLEQQSTTRRRHDKGFWGALDKTHKVGTILALMGLGVGSGKLLQMLGVATREEVGRLELEIHSIAEMIRPGSSFEIHQRAQTANHQHAQTGREE